MDDYYLDLANYLIWIIKRNGNLILVMWVVIMRFVKIKNIFTYNHKFTDKWTCNENRDVLNTKVKLDRVFVIDTEEKEYGFYYKVSCPNYTTKGYRNKYDAISDVMKYLVTDGVLIMRLEERLYKLGLYKKL